MNLNKAMLIGRLTRDPEMRYTPSGAPVTNFSIATNRYGTGADGDRKEYTDFHDIVVWNIGKRALAEHCAQYLHKGSLVYVEGRLSTRQWENKEGQKQRRTEITANDVEFLESRSQSAGGGGGAVAQGLDDDFAATSGGGGGSAPTPAAAPAAEGQDIDPDDIPF